MTVFKSYLLIVRSKYKIILMYTLLFVMMLFAYSGTSSPTEQDFENVTTVIGVVNEDSEGQFTQKFLEYVEQNAEVVELKNSEDSIQDALFFMQVDYIIHIPQGFSQKMLNGDDVSLDVKQVPNSLSGGLSQHILNGYLNAAHAYIAAGMSEDKLYEYIEKDLQYSTDVKVVGADVSTESNDLAKSVNSFNFANYGLLSIIITINALVLSSFHTPTIRARNKISKISNKELSTQMILGSITVALGVTFLLSTIAFIMNWSALMSINGLLFVINLILLSAFAVIFSFCLSEMTSNKNVIDAISIVVGLGFSMISGAFVPQELLGDTALNIAKLTPSYWFILNNSQIAQISNFSWQAFQPILNNYLIIVGFTIFTYIIFIGINKFRNKKQ